MIGAWMMYAAALGVLASCAGVALSRLQRWRGAATRWVWVAALVATMVTPVVLASIPRTLAPVAFASAAHPRHGTAAVPPGELLLGAWAMMTLLLAARVAVSAARLRRNRRAWEAVELQGESVLVAEGVGPALVGWRDPVTVVPRWALTLNDAAIALMLAHESEHRRAGDTTLRTVALIATIAMPWNPALWWIAAQLRLAVEIDCDQRVLRRAPDVRRYAALLIDVVEQMAFPDAHHAMALAWPPSSIERRITAMTSSRRPSSPRLAALGLGAVVLAAVAVACASPMPDPIAPNTAVAEAHDQLRIGTKVPYCGTAGCKEDTVPLKLEEYIEDRIRTNETAHSGEDTTIGVALCAPDHDCVKVDLQKRQAEKHLMLVRPNASMEGMTPEQRSTYLTNLKLQQEQEQLHATLQKP